MMKGATAAEKAALLAALDLDRRTVAVSRIDPEELQQILAAAKPAEEEAIGAAMDVVKRWQVLGTLHQDDQARVMGKLQQMQDVAKGLGIVIEDTPLDVILDLHAEAGDVAGADRLYGEMAQFGFKPHETKVSTLIEALAAAGKHKRASEIYKELEMLRIGVISLMNKGLRDAWLLWR